MTIYEKPTPQDRAVVALLGFLVSVLTTVFYLLLGPWGAIGFIIANAVLLIYRLAYLFGFIGATR